MATLSELSGYGYLVMQQYPTEQWYTTRERNVPGMIIV